MGRIINRVDKKPIANASIFLSNTTIGNESSADGNFILKGIKSGKYQIIVSVVGFKMYNENIIANDHTVDLNDIELTPDIKTLKEVSIHANSNVDREQYLKWFKEQFIGTSDQASRCVLLNPEVLDFDYDKNKSLLTASSYDFLKIENNALGYRLKYLVNNFSFCTNPALNNDLHYDGSVLFEEIKGNPSQEKRWRKNRQEVFEGSEIHFLRSLINNRLEEEGFRVLQWAIYQNPERPADSIIDSKILSFEKLKTVNGKKYSDSIRVWKKKRELKKILETLMDYPLDKDEIVKPTDQEDLYALGCDMDNLHVTYNKEHNFPKKGLTYHLNDRYNKEITIIQFKQPYAFFDKNGTIANVDGIALSGAWAQNRVAELLPFDYDSDTWQ
ncbi:carboxypeptidase-like regulatory domain-containing protein [Mucilaginibacter sp. BT774]|uniref:carboxypeptidase-like regulatory domain-containing protein n=1 Tax=Mucilaginibacter sp. BT774 TaxID=3062276 RepID=UPI002674ACEB|nr:carboxypeptidase-like regulatory domain-containing protein [Mucilaginibacter sp. BT774]MDO3626250.1 carboxypeptidase-like regulatory domain-containing protein [Mucilaginibacter sp. BT774]